MVQSLGSVNANACTGTKCVYPEYELAKSMATIPFLLPLRIVSLIKHMSSNSLVLYTTVTFLESQTNVLRYKASECGCC